MPIWFIMYNFMVEYFNNFYIYVYMKTGNINKTIKDVILKSLICATIYYSLVYFILFCIKTIMPKDKLVTIEEGLVNVNVNAAEMFIILIITSFTVAMSMFILYILLKNSELGIIVGTIICMICNWIGFLFGNVGGAIIFTTDNISLRTKNVSQWIYFIMCILYAVIMTFVVKFLINKKSEEIVLGDYFNSKR